MRTLPALESPPIVAELAAATGEDRWATLRSLGTPLVHGRLTTFVHLGEADSVDVHHFMARFPAFPSLGRVAPGLHAVTTRLPEGARIEYKLTVSTGDGTTADVDPHNPHRATDPFGANSVAYAPGYVEPWWTAPTEGHAVTLRRGFVESSAFERRRFVRWYHPTVDQPDRLPLLVVHDGSDFVNHAGIVDALDNLIRARAIPPVVAALIDSGDRLTEYADDPRHAEFVAEVVDAAIRRHRATRDPARHVYLGASMGAVAALAAAWRNGGPGGLVLLSGSFVTAVGGPMQRGPHFQPIIDFMARFTADPGRPAARIYQACGAYEGLAPDNRAFTSVLDRTGAAVRFEEARDGHHWHNWRDRLGAALVHTLSGADPATTGTVRT